MVYEDKMNKQTQRLWSSWEDYRREWCRREDFRSVLHKLLEGEDEDFQRHIQKGTIAAAKLGKRVAIIDRQEMIGGVSLHTGTIPSKTLREAILYLSGFRQRSFLKILSRYGVQLSDFSRSVQSGSAEWIKQDLIGQKQRPRSKLLSHFSSCPARRGAAFSAG